MEPLASKRQLQTAYRCDPDEKSRVRGRVLVAWEHQPLPPEQCLHVSAHTALQEPLQCLLSVENMSTERVSVRHILLGGSSGDNLSRRGLAFGSLLVRVG